MKLLLAKFFQTFKVKSPKVYAIIIALIGGLYVVSQQGVINIPDWIVDMLVGFGLLGGVHTSKIIKEII